MSRPSKSPRIPGVARRTSLSLVTAPRRSTSTSKTKASAVAASRSSKTAHKLVLLPSDPQTKPLAEYDESNVIGYETDAGVRVRERKSAAERMSKADRRRAGYRRMTAYCVAESVKMKQLSTFLKREHNVVPRAFDEALYVMYHLPLLPGYGPGSNIRSSAPPPAHDHDHAHATMSEAEENGYQGTYFASSPQGDNAFNTTTGYIATSPEDRRKREEEIVSESEDRPLLGDLGRTESADADVEITETEGSETEAEPSATRVSPTQPIPIPVPEEILADQPPPVPEHAMVAEAIFFAYGVVVFFGLDEDQEHSVLEDIAAAGALRRPRSEAKWEVEELHYAYDRSIASPRIYNDFFTFKSPSHLLSLSIAHALAQSTLLAYYESLTHAILSDPATTAIPQSLATTGALHLSRTEAMRLTGRLFKLRRDVVLAGNVLDVPEVFWEEASLRGLYDAVREYFEIGERVRGVEERVSGARDLLDAIHDHLNNNAMERITWIIIWLIVVACMVELGEVIARLVVHATSASKTASIGYSLLSNQAVTSSTPSVVVQHAASTAILFDPLSFSSKLARLCGIRSVMLNT
ncbi:hypothetical protein OF83DRAFT_1090917 [Amylostereum chailletii]|nr:hypothetical protein OF83DRAFT_1090917 [Amylostereum chailletii]